MKVVFASTPDQQEEIMELIKRLYYEVFPNYFTDQQISEFQKQNILHLSSSQFEKLDTLKDAYQVLASLQTLILILQSEDLDDQYMETFYKNTSILEEYGLSFPFEFSQFVEWKETKDDSLSIHTKVANELLV
jgi:hypothetical protein